MKHWFQRTPRTIGDFLTLAVGVAVIFGIAMQLPAVAGGIGAFLGILTPFAWGIVLAYILDIPTRFFAKKLFGGKRPLAVLLSYILMLGVVGLLVALVVPQLVSSVQSFVGKLGIYEAAIQDALAWVQTTFGLDTATLESYVELLTIRLEQWFEGISGAAAQAAAGAAAGVAGAAMDSFVTLAVSIYLLTGKEMLLRTVRTCLRAALPPRRGGQCAVGMHHGQPHLQRLHRRPARRRAARRGRDVSLDVAVPAGLRAAHRRCSSASPTSSRCWGPSSARCRARSSCCWSPRCRRWSSCSSSSSCSRSTATLLRRTSSAGPPACRAWACCWAIIVGGDLFGLPGMVIGVPTLAVAVTLLKQAVGAGLQARGIDAEGNPLPACGGNLTLCPLCGGAPHGTITKENAAPTGRERGRDVEQKILAGKTARLHAGLAVPGLCRGGVLPVFKQPQLRAGRAAGAAGILSPFAGGVVIAFVLNPLVETLHRAWMRGAPKLRWAAILLAYLTRCCCWGCWAGWCCRRSAAAL